MRSTMKNDSPLLLQQISSSEAGDETISNSLHRKGATPRSDSDGWPSIPEMRSTRGRNLQKGVPEQFSKGSKDVDCLITESEGDRSRRRPAIHRSGAINLWKNIWKPVKGFVLHGKNRSVTETKLGKFLGTL